MQHLVTVGDKKKKTHCGVFSSFVFSVLIDGCQHPEWGWNNTVPLKHSSATQGAPTEQPVEE